MKKTISITLLELAKLLKKKRISVRIGHGVGYVWGMAYEKAKAMYSSSRRLRRNI